MTACEQEAQFENQGTNVVVHGIEHGESLRIPALYLRDHCHCTKCRHEVTNQRQIDLYKLDQQITVKQLKPSANEICITFSDGHVGSWAVASLKSMKMTMSKSVYEFNMNFVNFPTNIINWNATDVKSIQSEVSFADLIQSQDTLLTCLENISKYGFCFVNGCSATIEGSQQVAERISFLRETHYGRMWSFSAKMDHKDTAYTTLALNAHTDTSYFTDPIGIQMLHVVEHKDGTGGESILIDGFHVAKLLHERNPRAYKILSTFPIPTRNDDLPKAFHQCNPQPMLRHCWESGKLCQVRFNNDDRTDLPLTDNIMDYYEAVHAWNQILRDEANVYVFKLTPGRLVLFDNWRLLHGRMSFTGYRRVVGCYIGHDDFQSALHVARVNKQ